MYDDSTCYQQMVIHGNKERYLFSGESANLAAWSGFQTGATVMSSPFPLLRVDNSFCLRVLISLTQDSDSAVSLQNTYI
jgi:hypothetical protein